MLFISDPTLTADNVTKVMDLLNDWNSLKYGVIPIIVPASQMKEIQKKFSNKKEIANECASYYVHCHPQPSWTHLAHHLYSKEEFTAVKMLKQFLPLRGKYQVVTYAGMTHALQTCTCSLCLLSWFITEVV